MGMVEADIEKLMETKWGRTYANFTCPVCNQLSEELVKVFMPTRYETPSKPQEIALSCSECGKEFNGQLTVIEGHPKMKLADHPSVDLSFTPLVLDDYYSEEYEMFLRNFDWRSSTLASFIGATGELKDLLRDNPENGGASIFNKMIFSQMFSVFEAFLADTLVHLIFDRQKNIEVFLNKHDKLQKQKVSLCDLLENQSQPVLDYIKSHIFKEIREETLFHNLPKVERLYAILGYKVFNDDRLKDSLMKASDLRHHCVHRNGHDMHGNVVDAYTYEYLMTTIEAMRVVALFIEHEILRAKREN
ncbi:hypothetical protein [Curvivirga sp.]|uniref:hypothetical protein n=1 Tax=Curvivirga sp. TaxID=2856848 RepID=UPI003B5B22EB